MQGQKGIVWLPLIIVMVIIGVGLAFKYKEDNTASTKPDISTTITPSPTQSGSKPDSKTQATSDSDPLVSCTSTSPNCSGQTIQLKRSACANIGCCQVGDKWSLYSSRAACTAAQEANQPSQQTGSSSNCEAGPGNWVHAATLQDCQNLQAQYYSAHNGTSTSTSPALQPSSLNSYTSPNPPTQNSTSNQQSRQNCIDSQTRLYNELISKCPKDSYGNWNDGGFCYSYTTQGYNQQLNACNSL